LPACHKPNVACHASRPMRRQTTLIILLAFFGTSCSEIRTNDPTESYKHWAGANPTEDIELLQGEYWQSSHWTREYILYLKFKPTDIWWTQFIKQNQLQSTTENWDAPSDSPDWFRPDDNFKTYKSTDDFNSSRYFKNELTGECYIYEIQL
jgi:hypothetical protein